MDIVIRELAAGDLAQGFLEVLAGVAAVSLTVEQAEEVFRDRTSAGVRTFVALDGAQVVGTASLLVERKFIHAGAACGHIEDVAAHPDYRHRGVGTTLIRHATEVARTMACYKVILNCYDRVMPFYEQCGYRRHDIGMRIDIAPG